MLTISRIDSNGKELPQGQYSIQINRIAKNVDGGDVEIIDHIEYVNMYQLNTAKDQLKKQLDAVQSNITQVDERIKAIVDFNKINISEKAKSIKANIAINEPLK